MVWYSVVHHWLCKSWILRSYQSYSAFPWCYIRSRYLTSRLSMKCAFIHRCLFPDNDLTSSLWAPPPSPSLSIPPTRSIHHVLNGAKACGSITLVWVCFCKGMAWYGMARHIIRVCDCTSAIYINHVFSFLLPCLISISYTTSSCPLKVIP